MTKFIEKYALYILIVLMAASSLLMLFKKDIVTCAFFVAITMIFCTTLIMVKMEKILK